MVTVNLMVQVRKRVRWCRCLVALITCIPGFPAVGQDASVITDDSEYARGIQAFAEGNFEQAADLWLADAYLGSANSQFNIGVLYTEGKGLPQDRAEAVFWFEKAARQGHLEAQYNLGHLLLEEQGDVEKIRQGITWWRQAAEGGFPLAQYNYGRALFHGIGVEEDRQAARDWFEQATRNGNKHAAEFVAAHADEFDIVVDDPAVTERVVVAAAETAPRVDPEAAEAPSAAFEYVGVRDEPALMYARFNTLSPIITRIDGRMLLRVVARKSDWILAAVPGGLPGWVLKANVKIDKDLVEVRSERALVHADPTEESDNNDIGELERGARVLLLEIQGDWVRVQLPEVIPGWIENSSVRSVTGEPGEIAAVWQRQQINRKVAALSSREIKVAAITGDSRASQPVEKKSARSTTVATADSIPLGGAGGLVLTSQDSTPGQPASVQPEATPAPAQGATTLEEQPTPRVTQVIPAPPRLVPPEPVDDGAVLVDETLGSAVGMAEPVVEASTNQQSPPRASSSSVATVESGVEEILASGTVGREPELVIEVNSVPEPVTRAEPEPEPKPEPRSPYFRLERSETAVRASPSSDAPVVTVLPENTLVDVVGYQGEFAEVSIPGGLPLWVPAADVRQRGNEAVVEGSRVRAWPDRGDERGRRAMGLLPEGSILRILEQQDGWVRVAVPEWMTGWVRRAGMRRPDSTEGISRIWRQQSTSLLAGYLNARTGEVAPAAGIQDDNLAGTGIDNDNRWLFQQGSRKYTLQLFSMQNLSSARSLFDSLNRRGQFFSTVVKGNRWYFVLLGRFLTRDSAEAVAATLPRWAGDARVRSLDRLQVNRCKKRGELSDGEAKDLGLLCR